MLEVMPEIEYANETRLFTKVFFVVKMREYRIKAFGKSLPERFSFFQAERAKTKILFTGGLPT